MSASEISGSGSDETRRDRFFCTRRGVMLGGAALAVYLTPLTVPHIGGIDTARLTSDRQVRGRLEPILAAARARNREAVVSTIARIDTAFDGYKERLVPFVDDVYSFSRLAKLAGLSVTDWFTGQNSAGDSVERLFRRHVFTEKKFKADLAGALESFQHVLRAESSALLFTDLEGAAAHSELRTDVNRERFAEMVLTHAAGAARPETRILTVEILSTGAAVTLAAMVGARLAASLAARAAAAGGGAAIGSWAPVVGTVVGAVIGFLADALVQHWVEEKAKDQMVAELGAKLDAVRHQMIEGDPQGTGLRHDLEAAAESFNWAQHSAVDSVIVGT